MSRRLAFVIAALVSLLPILPAPAEAAKKKRTAKKPEITRVTPMRIRVGAKVTIRGKNFSSRRKRNTVVFRAPSGRSAFAKPVRASRRKLVVRVPPALARVVGARSMRFKLRVLSRKFGKWTTRRLSPVVVGSGKSTAPGGGGGGGGAVSSCVAGDYDNDLLPGSYEISISLDPCLADTDGDGVSDGYEQQSAADLNFYPGQTPRPYPGKRPYPNALDPSDGFTDYDGDGLKLRDEHLLWHRYVTDGTRRSGAPATLADLSYSDGLQRSRAVPVPAGGSLARWALVLDFDPLYPYLDDDERDADGDGLGNWDEQWGRMTEGWWPAQHSGQNEPKESKYPELDYLDNEDTAPGLDAAADPDMDGDGIRDGDDDTDGDGLSNQFEVARPGDWIADAWGGDADVGVPGPNSWAYTNPFNPCKPFNSERCHSHPPFGYYESDEAPPIGPMPPAGYPTLHPTTPDG